MANPWFRAYSEFATDAKVQSMPEAMQRRLMMLFCLRCSDVLATLHDDEIAFALRITEDDLAETKALFMRKGFINDDWQLTNWEKRQYSSDSSTERSRKHRANKKSDVQQACNVAATPPEADTDTDSDTENKEASAVITGIAKDEKSKADASPISRSKEIAEYLRQRGIVGSNSENPNIIAWGDNARVTNEILEAALSVVRSRKLDVPAGPNYIAPIIADMLKPKSVAKKADEDWKRSAAGIERRASQLGIVPRIGESHPALKERCIAAEHELEHAA